MIIADLNILETVEAGNILGGCCCSKDYKDYDKDYDKEYDNYGKKKDKDEDKYYGKKEEEPEYKETLTIKINQEVFVIS
ncbi:hypothetical protein A2T98_10595 [Nodularia spumigena CENA596]|uniref:Uncharacterized protein n=1 Tax=Nodularia spumigena CENA596 TaxID=1819295 RepID=A0A161VRR4_NODSP|nr:hypothetical protein [Nodularia spumigena]KZL49845.1 hypothetical protein A2T98_10595 [Nodularia spumigena CENA596]